MKKITFFFAILFSLAFSYAFAQNNASKGPIITLKGLQAPEMKDGKQQPIYTTSDYITKNPSLVSNDPNVEVMEFTAGVGVGKEYTGPFEIKGNTLTQQVIDVIKKTKGPGVLVFFENIKVKDHGFIRPYTPVILKYDQ